MRVLKAIAIAVIVVSEVASARAEVIDRVLAIVAGQVITKSDVDTAAALGIAENVQQLIDRTLMLTEVRRVAPPDPTDSNIAARVAKMRGRFSSGADLVRALAMGGIDEAMLRIFAADDLRLATYLDERFAAASQPTDEELRQAGESARQRLAEEHRQALVTAWVSELRRRTEITLIE
jgi:parvulin-like peptidyl-prolyl isomerase